LKKRIATVSHFLKIAQVRFCSSFLYSFRYLFTFLIATGRMGLEELQLRHGHLGRAEFVGCLSADSNVGSSGSQEEAIFPSTFRIDAKQL